MRRYSHPAPVCILLSLSLAACLPLSAADSRRLEPPPHGFFTALPKEFGHLVSLNAGSVTVVLDRTGERLERKLLPGADLFHHGGPATPADFTPGDRVWLAMEGNAKRGERGDVRLLADEISVQDIHTEWYRLKERDTQTGPLTLEAPPAGGKPAPPIRLPSLPDAKLRRGSRTVPMSDLAPGASLRYQTRFVNGAYAISLLADAGGFEALQAEQRHALDRQLARSGLPGTAAAGLVAGDWEIVIDRAGSAWARTLSSGDAVRLAREDGSRARPVAVTVRSLHPWGERTLVVATPVTALEPPPASRPARVRLLMDRPRFGTLPPGLGRGRSADERTEWILASIYCTCGNSNDVCTGQLYTLSQCSPKGCPMPKFMRGKLATWIAEGKSDADILKLIEQEQGLLCHRMHLVK